MSARPRRLVRDNLVHDAGDQSSDSYLIAARCPKCQLVQFPRFWICPRCLDRSRLPEPFRLSGRATLERFIVAERGPREFNPPYVQGYVRAEEGPVFYSLIRGVSPTEPDLVRGQPMRLAVETVREDEGVDVVGWVARPAKTEE